MTEQEGVIKFQLDFTRRSALQLADTVEISSWRTVMLQLGMLGQTPLRYDNYGFGNISQRFGSNNQFIISGTQTGGINVMTASDYALVTCCEPGRNYIAATGETKPSSEAMTHGQLYQIDSRINFVIHAHLLDDSLACVFDIWDNFSNVLSDIHRHRYARIYLGTGARFHLKHFAKK